MGAYCVPRGTNERKQRTPAFRGLRVRWGAQRSTPESHKHIAGALRRRSSRGLC